MHDGHNGRTVCSNWWHYRSLFINWLWQRTHIYQYGRDNGDSTRANRPSLLQWIYLYIYLQKQCIYSEPKKAIYVTIEASLLFWTKLSKILEDMGYQRNKYDWCIVNKIVDDNQCIIICHINYLKMSHVYSNIFSNVLSDIYSEYGKLRKRPSRRVRYTNTSG